MVVDHQWSADHRLRTVAQKDRQERSLACSARVSQTKAAVLNSLLKGS